MRLVTYTGTLAYQQGVSWIGAVLCICIYFPVIWYLERRGYVIGYVEELRITRGGYGQPLTALTARLTDEEAKMRSTH